MPPRSAGFSGWWTITKPPTTCRRRLHRLTEIYLILGLTDQAQRTAAVLGHNYPGSRWYADSYRDLVQDGQVPDANGRIEHPGVLRAQSRLDLLI